MIVCRVKVLWDNQNCSNQVSVKELNKVLEERIKTLECQINKNSNNGSKPPSSDGFKKKTQSLRTKAGKQPGGQEGYEGTNDDPDEIKIHNVEQCSQCGASLKDVPAERYIVRQVIDIKVNVIEHRAEVKICPHCKSKNTADFPVEIKNTVQYGERIKAVAV